MTKSHTIEAPKKLVEQWIAAYMSKGSGVTLFEYFERVASCAAQWGYDQRESELQERADQELEACCALLGSSQAAELRAARRPKPPTLAEQGLKALGPLVSSTDFRTLTPAEQATIRTALNHLKKLEPEND